MKKAFSILMIVAVMLPNLTKVGIIIDFKLNQDFIAEVLCINKEKPMTVCYGHCYLSDQLQKADEKEDKQAPVSKKDKTEVVYCYIKNPLQFSANLDIHTGKLHAAYENEIYSSAFVADIFHPPKLTLI